MRLRPKTGKDWGELIEKLGEDKLQKHLSVFEENLPDTERFEKAVYLFNQDKLKEAEFVAELINEPEMRETLLYKIRSLNLRK
ncbi:MAG: hypothetical protein HC846_03045 [Blastocatellia bacterium]|nr:hypothetical protein [Blastocatellia bacterium]